MVLTIALIGQPFISPAMFEPYIDAAIPAVDEYTLSLNLGPQLREVLEQHYATFIVRRSTFAALTRQVEDDFAAIAAAGLNWVRIALPFWCAALCQSH